MSIYIYTYLHLYFQFNWFINIFGIIKIVKTKISQLSNQIRGCLLQIKVDFDYQAENQVKNMQSWIKYLRYIKNNLKYIKSCLNT